MLFYGTDTLKNAPSHGGSEPPYNTWFLGPTHVFFPNGISIGLAFFARLTKVTNRPTRYSLQCRPLSLAIAVMRPNY